MGRITVATLVACALSTAVAVPPATAAGTSQHTTNCGMFSRRPDPDVRRHEGYLFTYMVVYSTTASDNPVSAIVTCEIRVNGATRASATFSGTGVVAGVRAISFEENYSFEVLETCTTVDYTSDSTPTETVCNT